MDNKPVMYEWPESQICMDCEHGKFVMSDKLVNSNYLCMVECDRNDGVNCPNLFEKWSKDLRGVIPTKNLETGKLAKNEVYIVYTESVNERAIDQAFIARTEMQLDTVVTYEVKITGITKVRFIEKYTLPEK